MRVGTGVVLVGKPRTARFFAQCAKVAWVARVSISDLAGVVGAMGVATGGPVCTICFGGVGSVGVWLWGLGLGGPALGGAALREQRGRRRWTSAVHLSRWSWEQRKHYFLDGRVAWR